jgi:MYXO-CTERM domain-containing protein
VPNDCYHVPCEDGFVCVEGECTDDPCATVECDGDQYCVGGECVDMCAGGCADGELCVDGSCQDDPCAGVSCPEGTCNPETGECTTACDGVNCGEGRICDLATGDCIDDPCLTIHCPDDTHCEQGVCISDSSGGDGGPDTDGSVRMPMGILATGGGGCSCSTTGVPASGTTAGGLLLALLSFVTLRRLR